jgi:prophage regulatory protein
MRRARASQIPSKTERPEPNEEVPSRAIEAKASSWLPDPASANALLASRAKARRRSTDAPDSLDALQFLRINDVCRLLRISKPTLWRLRQSPEFPEPTGVTDRLIAWRRSEIEEWLRARSTNRRGAIGRPPRIRLGDEEQTADSARNASASQADRLSGREADASDLQMALLLSVPKR